MHEIVMVGFDSPADALQAFLGKHPNAKFRKLVVMPMDEFKAKVLATNSEPGPVKVLKYGTSAGDMRAWDTRGRGRKAKPKKPKKKPGTKDPDKVANAKSTYKPSDKETQDAARAWELKLAKIVGGKALPDHEPFDVVKGKVGIEAKLCLKQVDPEGRVNCHVSSRQRKEIESGNFSRVFTVALDSRGSSPVYYAKAGIGAFRFGSMTKLTSTAKLREFLK